MAALSYKEIKSKGGKMSENNMRYILESYDPSLFPKAIRQSRNINDLGVRAYFKLGLVLR